MAAIPYCPIGAEVEISDDGTLWTDISDFVRRIDPQERETPLLTFKTFTGPKSCTGPADPVDIEVEALYTEADTEPFAMIRDAHYNGTKLSIRWQVNTEVGGKQWVAADCSVPTFDEPEVSADSDEPLSFIGTLAADNITWLTAVATTAAEPEAAPA
jgi:hypothetical protein